jgi:hypothetical protein
LEHPPVLDRAALTAATELIDRFGGEHARLEAACRADECRSVGNVLQFCHWREIERTILMLELECVTGSVN